MHKKQGVSTKETPCFLLACPMKFSTPGKKQYSNINIQSNNINTSGVSPPAGRGRAFRSNLLPSGAKVFPLQSLTHSSVCRIDGPVNPVSRVATVPYQKNTEKPVRNVTSLLSTNFRPAIGRCPHRPK